jgi:hypothetical protein
MKNHGLPGGVIWALFLKALPGIIFALMVIAGFVALCIWLVTGGK